LNDIVKILIELDSEDQTSLDTAVVGSLQPSPEFLIILAVWRLVYICPCFHNHQTRQLNQDVGAITAALSFKKCAGIPSNPVAFFTFKSLSCFRIYFSEICCRMKIH